MKGKIDESTKFSGKQFPKNKYLRSHRNILLIAEGKIRLIILRFINLSRIANVRQMESYISEKRVK